MVVLARDEAVQQHAIQDHIRLVGRAPSDVNGRAAVGLGHRQIAIASQPVDIERVEAWNGLCTAATSVYSITSSARGSNVGGTAEAKCLQTVWHRRLIGSMQHPHLSRIKMA